MSEIRALLAAAQHAEVHGDLGEAVRLLRSAAQWYQDRQLHPRAEQMLRHVGRLLGQSSPPSPERPDDGEDPWELGVVEQIQMVVSDRRPVRAADGVEAWCSFCCRPAAEAGPLMAGPPGVGAFICGSCAALSARQLGAPAPPATASQPVPPPEPRSPSAPSLLPSQVAALERWKTRAPRLALLAGPAGAGKSTLLAALKQGLGGGEALATHEGPLDREQERALLAWLDERPARRAIIALTGTPPAPALTLTAADGGVVEVYDTASLVGALPAGTEALLGRVEQVLFLPPPGVDDLRALALQALGARGVSLPPAELDQLVALAARAARPAVELHALVARIPPGRYEAQSR